jgi:hypothetical protein
LTGGFIVKEDPSQKVVECPFDEQIEHHDPYVDTYEYGRRKVLEQLGSEPYTKIKQTEA